MDINGIATIANSSVLPEQRPKASTSSPIGVSGNRSSNRDAPQIPNGSSEAEDGAHKEALKKVVENTNKLMEISNIHLDYSIDESTQRVVVKVINGNTDEVIRQIPSEEMLELAAKFREINALLFSQKA